MEAYVALGSNLGDRERNLRAGLSGMVRRGVLLRAVSSVWETEPVDSPAPLWFLNLAARVESELPPLELLDLLLDVEREAGRVRAERNAPRLLDLDLLWMGGERCAGPRLILPHPRMWERRFVLAPLAEIAPDLRDPATGRGVAQALGALPERPEVRCRGPLAPPAAESGV